VAAVDLPLQLPLPLMAVAVAVADHGRVVYLQHLTFRLPWL
jgi:hypothetical protein